MCESYFRFLAFQHLEKDCSVIDTNLLFISTSHHFTSLTFKSATQGDTCRHEIQRYAITISRRFLAAFSYDLFAFF